MGTRLEMSPPTRSAKLKRIYGSKMNKTANLDNISIHIPIHYVYGWWLLPRGGALPPLNETLLIIAFVITMYVKKIAFCHSAKICYSHLTQDYFGHSSWFKHKSAPYYIAHDIGVV